MNRAWLAEALVDRLFDGDWERARHFASCGDCDLIGCGCCSFTCRAEDERRKVADEVRWDESHDSSECDDTCMVHGSGHDRPEEREGLR